MSHPQATRRLGFSLIEVMFSLVIIAILMASTFEITFNTYSSLGTIDASSILQSDSDQVFDRLTEALRKCGWSTLGGVTYPRVSADAKTLQFRILADLDGNGYPFNEVSGELEYSPKVFSVVRDANGNLRVMNGSTVVWHLARHVADMSFATYVQDPSLQMRELRVTVTFQMRDRKRDTIAFTRSECIEMRN